MTDFNPTTVEIIAALNQIAGGLRTDFADDNLLAGQWLDKAAEALAAQQERADKLQSAHDVHLENDGALVYECHICREES